MAVRRWTLGAVELPEEMKKRAGLSIHKKDPLKQFMLWIGANILQKHCSSQVTMVSLKAGRLQ